jgi:hypothetical protein
LNFPATKLLNSMPPALAGLLDAPITATERGAIIGVISLIRHLTCVLMAAFKTKKGGRCSISRQLTKLSLRDPKNNFAELLCGFDIPVCLGRLLQRKDFVNHRAEPASAEHR